MKTFFNLKAGLGTPRRYLPALVASTSVFLAACAASPPAPTEQIAVSKATVAQASSAGASELAPAELQTAREKLDRASVAMGSKDYEQARILAEQAQVDAQLAVTKARSVKAQKAAVAVQEDSRVLREEINRNTK